MNKEEELLKRLEEVKKRLRDTRSPNNAKDQEEYLLLSEQLELEGAKEYASMTAELAEAGIIISTVWDLVNTRASYPEAIPILLRHLPKNYDIRNKEGIVRALTVKEARGVASPILIEEYNRTPKVKSTSCYRWTFGNAVLVTFTENDVESILPIVQDKSNGMSRTAFIEALGKTKLSKERVENVLIELLDEEDIEDDIQGTTVIPSALRALRRLKSTKAKDKILMMRNHPLKVVREEVEKYIKKIVI